MIKPEMLEITRKFVLERESVRKKKEAGLPKPWTDWDPLLKFRFTNVRRMDDKVSDWLYQNWYKKHFDHPNMLIAAVLARQLNRIDSLSEAGFPLVFDVDSLEKTLRDRVERKEGNFSAAYMITGTLGGDKITQIVHKVLAPLVDVTVDTSSMEKSANNLLPHAGIGTFIAGQVVADLRWALSGSWADKDSWVPVGPGSNRWLRILHGEEDRRDDRLKNPEFSDKVLELKSVLCLEPEIQAIQEDRKLELMDWQNVCCESYKVWKWLHLGRAPKQNYFGTEPVSEEKPFWEV